MSALSHTLGRYIPFRRKPQISREQALAAKPFANPVLTWERNERGEAVIEIPLRQDRKAKVLGRIFGAPKRKQLVLDEAGSTVWELCDGEHSVASIIDEMIAKYKLNRREAETSVTMYLKTLAERNLVGLRAGAPPKREKAPRRKRR